jgi:hypothetical protein
MLEDAVVLAYTDVIVNASCIQIAQSFAAFELTRLMEFEGKADEPVYEFVPLLDIVVVPLVHHLEHDGEGYTVIDDAQREDIDV